MTVNDLILPWATAAVVGAVLLARGRLTLFHPVALYFGFHLVAFCLRPTVLHWAGLENTWEHLLPSPDPEALRRALLVSSSGLVAGVLGFIATSFRAGRLPDTEPAELDACDKRALLITAALVVVPAGAGVVLGLGTDPHPRYLVDLQMLLLPVALLTPLATHWSWWSLIPLIGLTFARTATGSPALWAVTNTIIVVGLLWLWHHRRRWPPAPAIILLGAASLTAAGLIDERSPLRTWVGGSEAPRAGASRSPELLEQLDRPAWAHLEALAGIVAVVPKKTGGFYHGRQHLASGQGAMAASRPRLAGDGDSPLLEDLSRHGRFHGLPIALVSDGWISGGWWGTVATLTLVGAIMGAAFRTFARRPGDAAAACFFLPVHVLALELYADSDTALGHRAIYLLVPMVLWRSMAARLRRGVAVQEDRERLREERQRRRLLGKAMLHPQAAALPPEVIAGAGPRDPTAPEATRPPTPSAPPDASQSPAPRRPSAPWQTPGPR